MIGIKSANSEKPEGWHRTFQAPRRFGRLRVGGAGARGRRGLVRLIVGWEEGEGQETKCAQRSGQQIEHGHVENIDLAIARLHRSAVSENVAIFVTQHHRRGKMPLMSCSGFNSKG